MKAINPKLSNKMIYINVIKKNYYHQLWMQKDYIQINKIIQNSYITELFFTKEKIFQSSVKTSAIEFCSSKLAFLFRLF